MVHRGRITLLYGRFFLVVRSFSKENVFAVFSHKIINQGTELSLSCHVTQLSVNELTLKLPCHSNTVSVDELTLKLPFHSSFC